MRALLREMDLPASGILHPTPRTCAARSAAATVIRSQGRLALLANLCALGGITHHSQP